MGEKTATSEVISKLVSALGDQSEDVRANVCKAFVEMGEKAATNEVISKLVSALGDQSQYVRGNASSALRQMGEKAATNEAINKLINNVNDESLVSLEAAEIVARVLSLSAVLVQLKPSVISALILSKPLSGCFRNISEYDIVKYCFKIQTADLLDAVAKIILLKGTAVTMIGDKVFVYGSKEPMELRAVNQEFAHNFAKALSRERDRMHLSLHMNVPEDMPNKWCVFL